MSNILTKSLSAAAVALLALPAVAKAQTAPAPNLKEFEKCMGDIAGFTGRTPTVNRSDVNVIARPFEEFAKIYQLPPPAKEYQLPGKPMIIEMWHMRNGTISYSRIGSETPASSQGPNIRVDYQSYQHVEVPYGQMLKLNTPDAATMKMLLDCARKSNYRGIYEPKPQ